MENLKTVWSYIRIKFRPGTDPKGKRTKFSRPTRIYKVEYFNSETGELVKVEYAPSGVKGTSRRIDPETFILEWERGPIPTPKPSHKYTDEQLRERGFSEDLIKSIRRNFSAKDIKIIRKNLECTKEEAVELLTKHKGNRHEIYMVKNKKGRRVNGEWKTTNPKGKPWTCPEGGGSRFYNKNWSPKKHHRVMMQTSRRNKKKS